MKPGRVKEPIGCGLRPPGRAQVARRGHGHDRRRYRGTMRFGFYLPQGQMADPRHDVTLVAREAERIGYDSLWVFERVLFPLNPADGMYGVPGLAWADLYRHTADPLTVLTLAASVTENVPLGTGVLVAGLHQPHSLARTMATLDQLSGG